MLSAIFFEVAMGLLTPWPAFGAFQRAWGQRPDPQAITVAIAIGLARPEFLVEIDAVAVVAE